MRKKIIIGVTIFFTVVIIATIYLALTVDPIRFKQITFDVQKNTEISQSASTYIKANEKVLAEITLNFDKVDTTVIATYKAYAYYKGKTYEFNIKIIDKKAPEIVIKEQLKEVYVGETLIASDFADVNDDSAYTVYFEKIKVSKTGSEINISDIGSEETITFHNEGTYDVFLGAEDEYGNKTTGSYRIQITVSKDSVGPEIFGIGNQVINLNTPFDIRKGVTAKDNIDGDMTSQVNVIGEVNTAKAGIYYITYQVTDSHGNLASQKRRIIVSTLYVPSDGDIQDLLNGEFMTQSEYYEMLELICTFNDSIESDKEINKISYINNYIYSLLSRGDINNDGNYATRSYDVLVKKEANSRLAVAKAFKMICDYLNIECYIVTGNDYSSNWAWNIVKIDGNYYHIDGYMNILNGKESYVYLLSDTSMINLGYSWKMSSYPTCYNDYN